MPRVLAVAILAVLWFPSSSFAATALVDRSGGEFNAVLIYAAAAGERNQVTVTFAGAGGGSLVLRDAGAGVQAGVGCTQIDAHAVGCAAASVVVDAGDGDDAVTLPAGPSGGTLLGIGGVGADTMSGGGSLYGGPGNDVLTGSDSAGCSIPRNDDCGETLVGGAGDDVLRGGGGGDSLIGDGANTPADNRPGIAEPGRGNDVIDGGVGGDTVGYPGRSAGVRVDLADSAPGGSEGERDRVSGVENAVGGDGADLLLGNDERNLLRGGGGDDRMDGRGGNDRLEDVGPGADTLRGGAGKDKLYAPGKSDRLFGGAGDDVLSPSSDGGLLRARTLDCGSGSDLVRGRPQGQLLAGCEVVQLNPPYIGPSMSARPRERPSGALRFNWSCYGPDVLVGCGMTVKLRLNAAPAARKTVAMAKVAIPRLAANSFDMRTNRPARRGDVLGVVIDGGLDYGQRGGTFKYAASWRVRL